MTRKAKSRAKPKQQRSVAHLIFMPAVHLLAIPAFFMVTWQNIAVFLVLYFLTACVGITFCYHRLLAHRAFKAPRWLMMVTLPFGVLNLMGGPTAFIGTHRMHHQSSDTDKDPHNAGYGFWFSHWGWLFQKNTELRNAKVFAGFAPDIYADPYMHFFDSFAAQLLLQIALGILLFALGGWGFVFWGIFLRLVWVYHLTFLTNSAAHLWGARPYDTPDNSRNNAWVGALSMGEGWQNNHHAFPKYARLGHKWWEIDVTYAMIAVFEGLGLVTDVERPRRRRAGA